MDLFKFLWTGVKEQQMLFGLLTGFALFPIYTAYADLPFWNDVAMRIMLLGMAAMGLNLILGYGGMVSFGHAAFVGIGAYCAGISQFYGLNNGWAHLGLSLGVCGILGLVISFLALRTSGIYFIMITLAFAQMLFFLFVSLEQYGGDDGMSINRADFMLFDLYNPLRLYYLIWSALLIISVILLFIVHSRFGVVLRAINNNESRVEALGLSPLRYKVTGYIISAMICGVAGTLFASWQEYVSPDIMHWSRSGELMIIIILGGLATLAGPLLGAVVFFILEELLPELLNLVAPSYAENWMIIFGPIMIFVVLFARGGLMGWVSRLAARRMSDHGVGQ